VVEGVEPALRAAAPLGVTVSVTGFEQIQAVGGSAGGASPSVLVETLIGGLGALAVLLFVYGSAVAIVPLLIVVPSILTTFLFVLGLTHLTDASFLVEYLVAVMRPGIAVDYSLLLRTRWREERKAGRSNEEAILAASPAAGRAVVLSGVTVVVGLLSLVLLPVPFLRSIGLGGVEFGGNTAPNVDFNGAPATGSASPGSCGSRPPPRQNAQPSPRTGSAGETSVAQT
jgi:putative drug exporter of the RND superfamily